MTAVIARIPLQTLPMSTVQSGPRRLSTRLQEKEDAHAKNSGVQPATGGISKKRRNGYDEEDDGFTFSRVNKNKKPRKSRENVATEPATANVAASSRVTARETSLQKPVKQPTVLPEERPNSDAPQKRKRKKMSFSTPKAKEEPPVRRSKRLSNDLAPTERNRSPVPARTPVENKAKRKKTTHTTREGTIEDAKPQPDPQPESQPEPSKDEQDKQTNDTERASERDHSATKISLPFADTPVIRRNKAMREGKGTKGDRRSSLGLRGRRASSLIDTGTSHALPHQEVAVTDFYKHIESDLLEPRRMRQLLTWCATRAMHAKPKGTDFEDASAKSAARVIEEELLKELSSKSELSDWFNREDLPEPPKPLPERPNPKNVQNLQKIAELEHRINRLRLERDSLQQLLQPPEILEFHEAYNQSTDIGSVGQGLLSDEDEALLDAVRSSSWLGADISLRINRIASSLGPSVDRFADGLHKIGQYRSVTDSMAGKVLAICADKFEDREKAGRRKALNTEEDRSPGRDLSNVLRGISKADR